MDVIAKEQNKKPEIKPFPLYFSRQKCYNEFQIESTPASTMNKQVCFLAVF